MFLPVHFGVAAGHAGGWNTRQDVSEVPENYRTHWEHSDYFVARGCGSRLCAHLSGGVHSHEDLSPLWIQSHEEVDCCLQCSDDTRAGGEQLAVHFHRVLLQPGHGLRKHFRLRSEHSVLAPNEKFLVQIRFRAALHHESDFSHFGCYYRQP